MAMTYNTLVQQITDYLNTTNAVTLAEIPNFIYNTHQEICRDFVNIGYEQYVNGVLIPNAVNGGSVIPKPSRWRRNVSFTYGSGPTFDQSNICYLRTYEYCRQFCPDGTNFVGTPTFYADYGNTHWLIVPTPDLYYPIQIGYIEMPQPLTVNNQTNWLTNYAPDVLLWGCLEKAIPFLKDDERISMIEKKYKEARESLRIQDVGNYYDRSSNRSAD